MNYEDEKILLWDIVLKINQSWTKGELNSIAQYIHNDVIVTNEEFNHLTKSKEELLQSYQHFYDNADIRGFKESDPVIDIIETTAIVSYKWNIKYIMKGIEYDEAGKEILVFAKVEDKWLVVWRSLLTDK